MMWTPEEDRLIIECAVWKRDFLELLLVFQKRGKNYTYPQLLARYEKLEEDKKKSEVEKPRIEVILDSLEGDVRLEFRKLYDSLLQNKIMPEDFIKKTEELNLPHILSECTCILPSHHKAAMQLRLALFAREKERLGQILVPVAKIGVQNMILQEREGEVIAAEELQKHSRVFVRFKREAEFESFMMEDSASYFSQKAIMWFNLPDFTCPDYMQRCEASLQQEKERFYHASLKINSKICETIQHQLLVVYGHKVLEDEQSGLCALLKDEKLLDLSRIYWLYHPIPGELNFVAHLFKKHVAAEVTALTKHGTSSASQVLFRNLDLLKKKFLVFVNGCFQCNSIFLKAIENAFAESCEEMVGIPLAKRLANYCNYILKEGGKKKLTYQAIEESLEDGLKLLPYIKDKDIFLGYYRKKLAGRLLHDDSVNVAHEESTRTKLEDSLGFQNLTSSMKYMLRDMEDSKQIQEKLKESVSGTTKYLGIEFSVIVIPVSNWPKFKSSPINLPSELASCVDVFESSFKEIITRKKLRWMHELEKCEIVGMFGQNSIELVLSTPQAAVLMLYNERDELSFKDIREKLGIDHQETIEVMHSLSGPEYKILIKIPDTETFKVTDSFHVNSSFTHKELRRIEVPRRRKGKDPALEKGPGLDRMYAVEAALVRIMKKNKILKVEDTQSRRSGS